MDYQYDIFISYARESSLKAEMLESLMASKVKIFRDVQIKWGDDFVDALNEGLRDSKFCLLLIDENYVNKLWTKQELKAAFARYMTQNHRRILPLMLDNVGEKYWSEQFILASPIQYRKWDGKKESAQILIDELQSILRL